MGEEQGLRVLVVDDEPNISDLVATVLRYEGFEVEVAATGRRALRAVAEFDPALIVLDVMLPDLDGFEVHRRLTAEGRTAPVLFLTARDATEDKVRGLSLGADDYVTKPFSLEELVARVRAILRRTAPVREERATSVLRFADLEIDEDAHEVRRAGTRIDLTATEYNLLRYLMLNPRRVLSKGQILDHVWHYDFGGDANVVETYISYLRRKVDAVEPNADPHRARRRLRPARAPMSRSIRPARSVGGCWRRRWCWWPSASRSRASPTYAFLNSFLVSRVDDQLRASPVRGATALLSSGGVSGPGGRADADQPFVPLYAVLPGPERPPRPASTRSPATTQQAAPAPTLPSDSPADRRHQRRRSACSRRLGRRLCDYRAIAAPVPNAGGTLVVAIPLTDVADTLHRLRAGRGARRRRAAGRWRRCRPSGSCGWDCGRSPTSRRRRARSRPATSRGA